MTVNGVTAANPRLLLIPVDEVVAGSFGEGVPIKVAHASS